MSDRRLTWMHPIGSRRWADYDVLDGPTWQGWVRVICHRNGSTYVVAENLNAAMWIDWGRGHLWEHAPAWWSRRFGG